MKLGIRAICLWAATACLLPSLELKAASETELAEDDAGWGLPSAPGAPTTSDEGDSPASAPPKEEEAATPPEESSATEAPSSETPGENLESVPHDLESIPDASAEPEVDDKRPPLRLRPLPPEPEADDEKAAALDDDWETPRPGQLALTVGVPFYDESILHGDMTVDVRYGRKFGWLVPYVSGGFRQTRLDPALVPDHARRKKLEAWHVSSGLRLEIPATQQLFPFIGIAGEITRWGFQADTHEYCEASFYPDAWRCYEPYRWKPGRAVKPQLGLIYKPEPSLALEFWVEHGTVDAPEMFTRRVTFFNPALGLSWHH